MDAKRPKRSGGEVRGLIRITGIEASGFYTNYPVDCIYLPLILKNLVCELFKMENLGWW